MSPNLAGTALGIFILLVVLFSLAGLLIVQRLRTERKRSKVQFAIESKQKDWFAYLIEGTISAGGLAPSSRVEIEAADEVLYRYRSNFNSEDLHYRIITYTEQYLEKYYRELLMSKTWSIRMNGLQRISLFNLQFMTPEVQKMAATGSSYSKEEILLIYKILASMTPTKFVPYFTNPAVPLGEFDYRRLLTSLDVDQLILLARQFDQLPVVLKRVLVDVTGSGYFLRLLPLLEHCLDSEDAELRIRALKAIALIDTFPSTSSTTVFVRSPIWEERLMVAKLYANAPLEEAHEILTTLLTDPVYQVRKQAAASLQDMRTGKSTLQEFIRHSEDPYAIDMAVEMIDKE